MKDNQPTFVYTSSEPRRHNKTYSIPVNMPHGRCMELSYKITLLQGTSYSLVQTPLLYDVSFIVTVSQMDGQTDRLCAVQSAKSEVNEEVLTKVNK